MTTKPVTPPRQKVRIHFSFMDTLIVYLAKVPVGNPHSIMNIRQPKRNSLCYFNVYSQCLHDHVLSQTLLLLHKKQIPQEIGAGFHITRVCLLTLLLCIRSWKMNSYNTEVTRIQLITPRLQANVDNLLVRKPVQTPPPPPTRPQKSRLRNAKSFSWFWKPRKSRKRRLQEENH
jgi:hypothetical protein